MVNQNSSYFHVAQDFYREVNNLRDVSATINKQIERSKSNRWKSVSIPFAEAGPCAVQIIHSSEIISEIFHGIKTAAHHDSLSYRAVAMEIECILKRQIDAFLGDKVSKKEFSSFIANFAHEKRQE